MAFQYNTPGDFRKMLMSPLTKHRHQSRPSPQITHRDTLDTLDHVSAVLLTQKTAHPLSPACGSSWTWLLSRQCNGSLFTSRGFADCWSPCGQQGNILTFIHSLLYTKFVFGALSVFSLIITINLLSKSYNYHFYNMTEWVKWKSLSRVWLFATPWTIQSMEFSRPEYWSG